MTSPAEDDEPQVGAGKDTAHLGYDVGRLLAFSDGVFAVAITLLVARTRPYVRRRSADSFCAKP